MFSEGKRTLVTLPSHRLKKEESRAKRISCIQVYHT